MLLFGVALMSALAVQYTGEFIRTSCFYSVSGKKEATIVFSAQLEQM